MKKVLQATSVAALVLLSAVGCSTCCGSRTSSASPCANGQCATTPTTTTMSPGMTSSGITASPMPTTMVTSPNKPPMAPVTGTPTSNSPTLLPQN